MCLFLCLLPMTGFLGLAYVVYFLAKRSKGKQETVGRVLCIWVLGMAFCLLVFGVCMQFLGDCPLERRLGRMFSDRQPARVVPAPALHKGGKPGGPPAGRSF